MKAHVSFFAVTLSALVVPTTGCPKKDPCLASAAGLTECVRQSMARTKAYRAKMRYTVQHAPPKGEDGVPSDVRVLSQGDAEVWFERPLSLRVESQSSAQSLTSEGKIMSRHVVVATDDEMLQQAELRNEAGEVQVTHTKVNRAVLAEGREPFDAGIGLQGTGFVPGCELFGSIEYILDVYTFEGLPQPTTVDGQKAYAITGKRSLAKFLDELYEKRHGMVFEPLTTMLVADPQDEETAAQLKAAINMTAATLKGFEKLRLVVSADDWMPLGWQMGPTVDRPKHLAEVVELEPAEDIPDERFTLDLAETATVTDGTGQVFEVRKALGKAVTENPELVEKVKSEIVKALQSDLVKAFSGE